MCNHSDRNIINIPTIKTDARPEMSFMYKYRVNVKDCHPSHLLMYEIRFVGRAGFIKRSFPYEVLEAERSSFVELGFCLIMMGFYTHVLCMIKIKTYY